MSKRCSLLFGLVFRNDWFSSRDWHIEAEFRPRYRSVPPVPDTHASVANQCLPVYHRLLCVSIKLIVATRYEQRAHLHKCKPLATYRVHDCQCRYSVGPLANHQPDSQDRTEPILRAWSRRETNDE